MEMQMEQAQPGRADAVRRERAGPDGGGLQTEASGGDALSAVARRANAGPHASSLAALQALVAQRTCADCDTVRRTMGGGAPVQRAAQGVPPFALHPAGPSSARITRATAAGAAPLQRARINYAPGAADRYSAIVGALQGNPAVAALIERVLAGGDVTLRIDDGDDTRYDRRSRTIFVSRSKNANQARAAILFELNNAANPHAHTDAAEGVMTTMAERGEAPGGGDYLHVAREMEKDEFISLVNYAHQAQGLGASGPAAAALREKYEALLAQGGGLSYDAFVAQNRRSGHTLDLAQAQHGAFTGKSSAEFPGIPLEFRDPVRYEAYQAGTGSARVRGQIAKTLAAEAGQFPVDARFTAAAPAWNPATIAAGYHQPLATLPVLPSSTATASVTAASSNDASSSVQAPSLATMPDAGQASVPLATAPPTPPRRVGPSALERRLGFSIALSPEEIEEDLALIRGLS